MTTQTNAAASAQPSNPYLSGIWWDKEWVTNGNPNGAVIITYAASGTYTPNAAEIAAYEQVFADISSICNITFVQGSAATADLVMNAGTGMQMAMEMNVSSTALGVADPPGTFIDAGGDEESWVFINRDQYSSNGLNKGGYDYITWLHEIGHALGLAHPHDTGGGSTIYPGVTSPFGSLGTDNLNQGIFTTMSYNDGWAAQKAGYPQQYGWQATMMAFDVAALQLKYGANMTTRTGNDVYVLRDTTGVGNYAQCIWDAGGTDTMYYGGALSTVMDLRAATLGTGYGAGGYISYVSGAATSFNLFTIANGVTIENATGGSATDVVYGNNARNIIYTLGGNDWVATFGGVDTIVTDTGNDIIYAGAGNDIIYCGAGFDQVFGESGNDSFFGGSDGDYFYMAFDTVNGNFDYYYDLTPGQDLLLFQSSQQLSMTFTASGGNAFCYVVLAAGGGYSFGAAGLTPAQLQAMIYFY